MNWAWIFIACEQHDGGDTKQKLSSADAPYVITLQYNL